MPVQPGPLGPVEDDDLLKLLTRLFGSRNQRMLRGYSRQVAAANALEQTFQALDDEALRARTLEFRARLKDGAALDSLIPEVCAAVREAARRTLGLRHFDVQLVGGLALHEGKIAEMRTGEGKTLVATLPAYLNALTGQSVHVVTVNEYLAQRDADWMGPVYRFLGLTVGVIRSGQTPDEKRAAYAADITYGTNNEFGFDYLRDNLAFRREDQMQRELAYAIVDEVDSILIDEARTPLIISGPAEDSSELYLAINKLVPQLEQQQMPGAKRNADIEAGKVHLTGPRGEDLGAMALDDALAMAEDKGLHVVEVDPKARPVACKLLPPGHYTVDEKGRQAYLTEDGHQQVERLLLKEGLLHEDESLYDAGNIRLMHHLTAALRAHAIFRKDVQYILRDGEIVIVDEFTGRTMPGRRWSDGLHQAIEAKEGVRVKEENQTVASITFQNYFRLYRKLSGMTGTADTEAFEFQQIYGLEVMVIPTHRPMIRDDQPDLVFLTQKDKFDAIIEDIRDCAERGQPVLVGTTSIETSEYLADLLKKQKVPHEILNAKQHEREAHIVAQAGRPGAVTIATNMAGRGTDIVLGGSLEVELSGLGTEAGEEERARVREDWEKRHAQVLAAGGLRIIGTERHESRRIDNQLRGRAGRQGDPGSSRFYLSLEDTLMRIFGDPERTKAMLARVGMKPGEAIESKLLTRQIANAQRKVEAHNFDMRKQLLEYDDVANDQRKVIYAQRNELMASEEIGAAIAGIRDEVVNTVISQHIVPESVEEQWDVPGLQQALEAEFGLEVDVQALLDQDQRLDEEGLRRKLADQLAARYEEKSTQVGPEVMRQVEKAVMLQQLDTSWKEHLAAMDYLRQGIHLRGYAQKNPKQEYKREAFDMFGQMLDQVKLQVIGILCKARIRGSEELQALEAQRRAAQKIEYRHEEAPSAVAAAPAAAPGAAPAPGLRGMGRPIPPPPMPPPQAGPVTREAPKVGRNQPCPCGSGKKFKHCHGRLE